MYLLSSWPERLSKVAQVKIQKTIFRYNKCAIRASLLVHPFGIDHPRATRACRLLMAPGMLLVAFSSTQGPRPMQARPSARYRTARLSCLLRLPAPRTARTAPLPRFATTCAKRADARWRCQCPCLIATERAGRARRRKYPQIRAKLLQQQQPSAQCPLWQWRRSTARLDTAHSTLIPPDRLLSIAAKATSNSGRTKSMLGSRKGRPG